MTDKTLAGQFRARAAFTADHSRKSDLIEAADALDAKDAEIARLRAAGTALWDAAAGISVPAAHALDWASLEDYDRGALERALDHLTSVMTPELSAVLRQP